MLLQKAPTDAALLFVRAHRHRSDIRPPTADTAERFITIGKIAAISQLMLRARLGAGSNRGKGGWLPWLGHAPAQH
jgi:hypothetical protein